MLKMISEIDQNSASIMEEIDKFKDSDSRGRNRLRKKGIIPAVLDMLNGHNLN